MSVTKALRRPHTARSVAGMCTVLTVLMVTGWGGFFTVVLPGHYTVGDGALFGLGLAFTAFTLGIRHALDADHIAAIDNTTRKLADNEAVPVSVGFWFALGHSTVVVVAVALLAAGANALANQLSQDDSTLASITGIWGPLVSGAFLVLIGTVNLVTLVGIWRVFRRLRTGAYDEAQLEARLRGRGALSRVLYPLTRHIDRPWKMYPIGLLFGLGFDTATTIGLFVIGSGAALTAPWYVVMVLPVLFTAGMTLFDTLDGILMNRAYRWAYARPVRKVYYNLTVTAMSVAIAFLVGGVVLAGLVSRWTGVQDGPLAWLAAVDLENFGAAVVSLFALTWLGSVAYWKLGRIEQRYALIE
jgi:nickel/cobalt transporter (NiCoT) family protein